MSFSSGGGSKSGPSKEGHRQMFVPLSDVMLEVLESKVADRDFTCSPASFSVIDYLDFLPSLEAEVLYLLKDKGKNQRDVALLLNTSQPTVSYRYRRVLSKLSYIMVLRSVDLPSIVGELPKLKQKEKDVLLSLFYKANQVLVGTEFGLRQALALPTPLLTNAGWKTISSVNVGDKVRGLDGSWINVVAKSSVEVRNSYSLSFKGTNETIVADESHLWRVFLPKKCTLLTSSRVSDNKPSLDPSMDEFILDTKTLYSLCDSGVINSSDIKVRVAPPLSNTPTTTLSPIECVSPSPLSLHPYVLGSWLGSLSTLCGLPLLKVHSPESGSYLGALLSDLTFETEGVFSSKILSESINDFSFSLTNGIYERSIPRLYLESPVTDRMSLLSGLIDSFGFVESGVVTFLGSDKDFMMDVWELVSGLGHKVRFSEGNSLCTSSLKFCKIDFTLSLLLSKFLASPYSCKCASNDIPSLTTSSPAGVSLPPPLSDLSTLLWRVKEIKKVSDVETQCIQVDSPDGMYLVGRSLIPTHNSSVKWIFVKAKRNLAELEKVDPEKWGKHYALMLLLERNLRMRIFS